jgi:hypothetical protein
MMGASLDDREEHHESAPEMFVLRRSAWDGVLGHRRPCNYGFGRGKPITAQDLAGKTFCWADGGRVTYGANGLETNNKNNHHPPWSVPEPGVLKYWGKKYTQVELLPDGRLHFYKYCLICGNHDIDSWATPCN